MKDKKQIMLDELSKEPEMIITWQPLPKPYEEMRGSKNGNK